MPSTAKGNKAAARGKPKKPRPDFPLFPHARGYWAKKVRGKLVYFGRIADDPEGKAAIDQWLDQRDELLAGRTPRPKGETGETVLDVANHFMFSKKRSMQAGEISSRTYADYHATCERILEAMGRNRLATDLASDDFDTYRSKLAKTWGPVRLGNEVQRVRTLFKHAFEADLLERPMKFGPAFKKPSRKVLRLNRAKKGVRMFEATQIHSLVAEASLAVEAMIMLAINCGLGNSDCAHLEFRHLDLKGGWLDYPRPKTGVERRCPLWPETVKAVKGAIAKRPAPKSVEHANVVFITKYKRLWTTGGPDSPITKAFDKIAEEVGCKRPGLSFYALRHTFATVAGESRDQPAVDHIMGHARDDMASVYREKISDERLKAVTDHVNRWLFPQKKAKTSTKNR